MKQILTRSFSVALACIMVLALIPISAFAASDTVMEATPVKNVIFMIGDGMGLNHVEAADMPNLKKITDKTTCTIYSANSATTDGFTDSAAAATALLTGVQANNNVVGLDANGKPVQNMVECVQPLGAYPGAQMTLREDGSEADLTSIVADITVKAAYAAAYINPYTDIDQNAQKPKWYVEAVEYVTGHEIMNGMNETQFGPNTTTNRAMFMTVLYRAAGSPDVSELAELTFPDYDGARYYADAAKWSVENGVVEGTNQGMLEPMRSITREELITMLYRYADKIYSADGGTTAGIDISYNENTTLEIFADSDQIHPYAQDSLKWAIAKGYVNGYIVEVAADLTQSILKPRSGATRAEMAKILMCFLTDEHNPKPTDVR